MRKTMSAKSKVHAGISQQSTEASDPKQKEGLKELEAMLPDGTAKIDIVDEQAAKANDLPYTKNEPDTARDS